MDFDFGPAKTVITQYKCKLGLADTAAIKDYLQRFDVAVDQFKELNEIKHDDVRAAAQIAVDMSKTLIQIALAGLAAFVAFTQVSGFPPFISIRFALMGVTVLLFGLSIMEGAFVVSGIWQRGEGRKKSEENPPWSTKNASTAINWQVWLGIGAALLFGLLVLFRPQAQTARGFDLGFPGGDRYTTFGEISINGQWENLNIVNNRTQEKCQLPPTKCGQTDSITITPK